MSTQRFPTLVWADSSGHSAAIIGDYEHAAAHAPTRDAALLQLRELLEWRAENEPWSVISELEHAVLSEVKIEIRPQYKHGERLVPCPETVWLRVPCVTATKESGLTICFVPHFALEFTFQDTDALKSLVNHYVKDAIQRFSPLELAGRLPPRNCELVEIVVRNAEGRVRQVAPADRPQLKPLFAVADPLLQSGGRGKTAAAYGRESLAASIAAKLDKEKTSILLVGEPGVGKSSVLVEAVKNLARSSTPEQDADEPALPLPFRFWRSSVGRLIAGMRYLGEWEERCEAFIRQLSEIQGIFCAENALELIQVGGQGPGDSVAAFLAPYLQSGELRMVSEATPAEVEACRRLLPGYLDFFQIITVPAFDHTQALQVLEKIATTSATTARLELAPLAVNLAHGLFKRFQPYLTFPGPTANFVRALCDPRSKLPRAQPNAISVADVVALFLKQTGLPEIFLRDELPLTFEQVHSFFAQRIIGQPAATALASQLVLKIKAGLTDPLRPFGVFLFCGPTGVGKTALAKALSAYCFGSTGRDNRLVQLDMSEYSGWDAAHRCLHHPQGGPAAWIERVRRQPFSVVLFDEIEKASPDVFDLLLGLLDEGRLTDRFGRITYFRSSIIILTSNIGASLSAPIGFSSQPSTAYEYEVAKFFRPEFFNRLDGVVTFHPLGVDQMEAIAEKEMRDLASREGLAAAQLQLAWTPRLLTAIAREGYDRHLGARPLQRTLERLVVVPLARWRVAHPHVQNTKLTIDLGQNHELVVQLPN